MDPSWATHELKRILTLLASRSSAQVEYLRGLGTLPEVDELALEFDDVANLVPALLTAGQLSQKQADAVESVACLLEKLTNQHNPDLWTESALRDYQGWHDIRRAAKQALDKLAA